MGNTLQKSGLYLTYRFETDHQQCIHTAEFGAPFVKGNRTYTMLTAQPSKKRSSIGLFKDHHDLAISKF